MHEANESKNISRSTTNYTVSVLNETTNGASLQSIGPPIPFCNFALPRVDGPSVRGFQEGPLAMQINDSFVMDATMAAQISAFTVFRTTVDNMTDVADGITRQWFNVTQVDAFECRLDACVQKYTSRMDLNVFSETPNGTFFNDTLLAGIDPNADDNPVVLPIHIQAPSHFTGHSDANGANTFSMESETAMGLRITFRGYLRDHGLWFGDIYAHESGDVFTESDVATIFSNTSNEEIKGIAHSVAASR